MASLSVFPILVGVIFIFLWVLVHQLAIRYPGNPHTMGPGLVYQWTIRQPVYLNPPLGRVHELALA
jgi:hypothetical protein